MVQILLGLGTFGVALIVYYAVKASHTGVHGIGGAVLCWELGIIGIGSFVAKQFIEINLWIQVIATIAAVCFCYYELYRYFGRWFPPFLRR